MGHLRMHDMCQWCFYLRQKLGRARVSARVALVQWVAGVNGVDHVGFGPPRFEKAHAPCQLGWAHQAPNRGTTAPQRHINLSTAVSPSLDLAVSPYRIGSGGVARLRYFFRAGAQGVAMGSKIKDLAESSKVQRYS